MKTVAGITLSKHARRRKKSWPKNSYGMSIFPSRTADTLVNPRPTSRCLRKFMRMT